MKKIIKIAGITLAGLFLVGFVTHRIWIHNPYEEALQFDIEQLFDASPAEFVIKNANLIDVVEGNVKAKKHMLIRGDSIACIYESQLPDSVAEIEAYDAQGKYVMPGLIDLHIHLFSRPELALSDFEDKDSLAVLVELEQSNRIISPMLFATGDLITVPGSHPITTLLGLPEDTDAQ